MPIDDDLDRALSFDGLAAAERITGESYKIDPSTEALGFVLFTNNNDLKMKMLSQRDDTHFGTDFANTLRIYQDEGFKIVYEEEFPGGSEVTEHYVILWRNGLLAVVESYSWDNDDIRHTNTNKLYFNLKLKSKNWPSRLSCSGQLIADPSDNRISILIGNKDVREGLRHALRKLEDEGEILPVWIKQPFLWLVNYNRSKSLNRDTHEYEEVTRQIINKLPEEVRSAIRPGEGHDH